MLGDEPINDAGLPSAKPACNPPLIPDGFWFMWAMHRHFGLANVPRSGLEPYIEIKTLQAGGKTWFLIGPDYAFGHSLAGDTARAVQAQDSGAQVLRCATEAVIS